MQNSPAAAVSSLFTATDASTVTERAAISTVSADGVSPASVGSVGSSLSEG